METVIVSLLSGLVGAVLASIGTLLAVYLNSRLEKNATGYSGSETFSPDLSGYRYLLVPPWIWRNSGEPYIALNEAFVAFDDSPPVIDALEKYRVDRNNNNLVTLFKAMFKSSGVHFDHLNDDFIIHPLGPPTPKDE